MQTINLLPPEIKILDQRRRANVRLVRLSVLALFVVLAGLVVLATVRTNAQEAQRLLEERVASLEANLEPFAAIENEVALIGDRLGISNSIVTQLVSWHQLAEVVAGQTPTDIQLENVSPTAKNGRFVVTITGQAGSRASVIAFKNNLEVTAFFSDLQILSTQLVAGSQPERIIFTLSGSIGEPTSHNENSQGLPSEQENS